MRIEGKRTIEISFWPCTFGFLSPVNVVWTSSCVRVCVCVFECMCLILKQHISLIFSLLEWIATLLQVYLHLTHSSWNNTTSNNNFQFPVHMWFCASHTHTHIHHLTLTNEYHVQSFYLISLLVLWGLSGFVVVVFFLTFYSFIYLFLCVCVCVCLIVCFFAIYSIFAKAAENANVWWEAWMPRVCHADKLNDFMIYLVAFCGIVRM